MLSIFQTLFKFQTTLNLTLFSKPTIHTNTTTPASPVTTPLPSKFPRRLHPVCKLNIRHTIAGRVLARNQKKRLVSRLRSACQAKRAQQATTMTQDSLYAITGSDYGVPPPEHGIGYRVAEKNQHRRDLSVGAEKELRIWSGADHRGDSVGARVAAKNANLRLEKGSGC